MTPSSADELVQRWQTLFFALFLGGSASWIAWRMGYYRLAANVAGCKVHARHVFGAFGIFLFVELILMPSLYLIWLSIEQGIVVFSSSVKLDPAAQGWLNLLAILFTAIALGIFYRSLEEGCRKEVLGAPQSFLKTYVNILLGSATWLLAYPWILALSQITGIILHYSYPGPHVDQVAVRHIKEIMSQPLLLYATIFTVIFLIPIVEELLFRGFLQTWLKNIFGRGAAIVLTSCIFALFHFSASQGIENIEILLSLFLLSCYLGFIRERQNALIASISLHATFNAVSIGFLLAA